METQQGPFLSCQSSDILNQPTMTRGKAVRSSCFSGLGSKRSQHVLGKSRSLAQQHTRVARQHRSKSSESENLHRARPAVRKAKERRCLIGTGPAFG